MDITCPYCGQMNLSATVPICTKCNKYWFIKDLNINEKNNFIKLNTLYSKLCNNNDFIKKQDNYNIIADKYDNIKSLYSDIRTERNNLLHNIYRKLNWIGPLILIIETIKSEIKNKSFTYNQINIKYITCLSSKSYLSSIYDCKALIESKRHLIPNTFENNRRLVQLKNFICELYSNLEYRIIIFNKYDLQSTISKFINLELVYFNLECVLDNFSEIGTKSLEDKCKELSYLNKSVSGVIHYNIRSDIICRIFNY